MQCPHCQREYDTKPHVFALGEDPDGAWQVASSRCPTCERLIVTLCTVDGCSYPVRPLASTRPRLSEDVPASLATDYQAAAQIVFYSAEASAALGRRLLHRFLGEQLDAREPGLHGRIRETLVSAEVPAYLKEALRTYSQVAKLSAEGNKSTHPEALAAVEPGEADWLLDVLQSFFELYFVEPARMRRRLDSLEEQVGLPTDMSLTPSGPAKGAAAGAEPLV